MTQIFFDMKYFFLKRNKQTGSLICLKNCKMNNFLVILELYAFYIEYKKVQNSWQLTFVVKPMLNILCKRSFCDFVKTPEKFLPFPC